MANVQHASLTGANLHEPKGVDAAAANKVYVSDGVGSGTWQKVEEGQVGSTGENQGRILVSDGANGAAWDTAVWKDLIGDVTPKTSGVGAPTLAAFRGGNVRAFFYSAGDDGDCQFHIPHDYKPGSDLYLHVHWAHNGTAISGNLVINFYVTYAKGHNQANFPAEINPSITYNTTNIATTPQYRHRIEEIQLSAASPSATQLDSDDIEVDGVISIHYDVTTIPTITGGSTNEPAILFVDLHYQANYFGTKNKVPNFYA